MLAVIHVSDLGGNSVMQKTYSCSWSLSYSAILRSQADSLRSHMILHEWLAFYSAFLNIHRSGVHKWLVPHETAAVSAQVLCTPCYHAPCHFMQSHICKVYSCLAVTCHLHFWQHDRDLLRATVVTWGWNRCWNKSQHRKSTLEKKILLLLLQGFEHATFQSWVWHYIHWAIHSNHWAIPSNHWAICANNRRYRRIQSLIQNYIRREHSESAPERKIELYKSYD